MWEGRSREAPPYPDLWPISEAPKANSRVRLTRVQRPLLAMESGTVWVENICSTRGAGVEILEDPTRRGARGTSVRTKLRKNIRRNFSL